MSVNRREFIVGGAGAALAQGARKPNFVFILSDDQHYQCLGAAGNPHIRTPNLDRLAARGVRFVNGTISTAQCCPSRGVLLSGLETFQNGLKSNGATRFRDDLGPTVIDQLRRGGYDTALVGKWHISNPPGECGFSRAPLWLREGGSRYLDPVLIRGLEGASKTETGHITDLFTSAAVEYVANATRPFFLWLAYNAPHTPWYAPPRYAAVYNTGAARDLAPPAHPANSKPFDWATYYAVISHLDDGVGRLIAQIERSGLWDNTVIVFLGDNGFLCGTKGLNGKVHPWEESVRVPLIAAGRNVSRGVSVEDPVASIDLPATWLDLAGIRPANMLAGRSLRRVFETGKGGPTDAFAVWDDPRAEALAIRTAVEPYREVRTRRHKLILWESKKQALFDHVDDPGEERNLIDSPRARLVRDDLRQRLAARMKATGDRALGWL